MTLDEAIKELEERAFWKRDAAEMAEDDNGIGNEVALAEAAEDEQLAEWLRELKEAKRLLKAAIKDIGDMSRYCLGMCCDSCPQIHTLSRGYQSCIWQHEDEALKLLND